MLAKTSIGSKVTWTYQEINYAIHDNLIMRPIIVMERSRQRDPKLGNYAYSDNSLDKVESRVSSPEKASDLRRWRWVVTVRSVCSECRLNRSKQGILRRLHTIRARIHICVRIYFKEKYLYAQACTHTTKQPCTS